MTKRQTTTNYRKSPQTTRDREKTKTTTHHRKPPQITTIIWGIGSETRYDAGKPPQTTANHHQNTRKKSLIVLFFFKWPKHADIYISIHAVCMIFIFICKQLFSLHRKALARGQLLRLCTFVAPPTLTFQIVVHIRLFIFRNIAVLYGLIRVYTFIRFVSNPPYTIFILSMFITLNII